MLMQNTKNSHLKSTSHVQLIMHDVLKRARALGATDACVSVNYDSGFSVDVRMNEVETVSFSTDQGVAVTVYFGHQKGSASSSDLSADALDAMLQAACDIARVSAADPCFGLPDQSELCLEYPGLNLYTPWNITPQAAIEKALQCESMALKLDPRIVNSDGVNVSTYTFLQGYASTQGFEGLVESSRHQMSCSLLANDGSKMQRDYEYTCARDPEHMICPEALARGAVARATSRLGARTMKTQKSPVVFDSRVSSGLFSTFMNAISGGALYRHQSFLCDAVGQRLFPADVRIHEQPHLLGALGSAPFDGEGLVTRNNVFVDHGILQQYMLGSYSARKLGLKTTADTGGPFNLTIDPTAGDRDDVLKRMGTGLFVTELMGQGVNLQTGDYSRGASGFWVENGRIQFPVEEVTIAGQLKNMFLDIQAIGMDRNPNSSTRCGSVLIGEMMIAGS